MKNLDTVVDVHIFTYKKVKAMQWMGGNSEIIMAMLEQTTTVGSYPTVMTYYLSISYYITLNTRDNKYYTVIPPLHILMNILDTILLLSILAPPYAYTPPYYYYIPYALMSIYAWIYEKKVGSHL